MTPTQLCSLTAQAELPALVMFGGTEVELWPYRRRTVALLRRYARASVEVGRLPSLLGREFFRSRVTSYTMRNFEDVVIFVADMEQAIEKLNGLERKLLAMNVGGIHHTRGRAAAGVYPANDRAVSPELARPSLIHPACRGSDGEIAFGYAGG
jgi:hypothetical protein